MITSNSTYAEIETQKSQDEQNIQPQFGISKACFLP